MKFEIGVVKDFDGFTGQIVSNSGNYMFLDVDIVDNYAIAINDYVSFRAEENNNIKRAYFIKFMTKNVEDIKNNKLNLEKFLKSDGGNL